MADNKKHILIGIFDIEDTPKLCSVDNFIPLYDYSKFDIEITSPWEYGAFKFNDTYLRIFVCSLHPHFLKYLK